MLTLTTTKLLDHSLLIASQLDDRSDEPTLIFINWLNGNNWKDSKTLGIFKSYYQLDDNSIIFIRQNSLSNKKANEKLLIKTIKQLNQFISGRRQTFELPLDTSIGTPFQQKVWQALQDIDYGQTISYAQLAKNISNPKAFRAVANANGKNPFSIVIPCHRVTGSDGRLGGYTGGIDKKQWLLEVEGILI